MSEVNVPKLRFREFEGEWVEKRLGEQCFNISSGKTKVGEFGDYPLYGSTGIIGKTKKFTHDGNYILVARVGANAGLTNYVVGQFSVTDNTLIIDIDKEKIISKFVLYSLHRYNLNKLIFGSGQPLITGGQLKSLKLNLPQKPEQQKIANFLTSIDQKIEQLTKKEKLLVAYKKGVMQKIFSRQIRFRDENGEVYGDWVERKFKDIGEIVGGGTPKTDKNEYWNGDIEWFTPTEIKSKYIKSSKRKISKLGLKKSSAKILPIGTILLTSRATVGDVGIAMKKCTTNQGFQSIIVNDKNNNEFIYYWILKNRKEFLRRSSGSTFIEISKHEINKIDINLPSKAEQTKIANFLSSIDKKIAQVNRQIEESKCFKKGLLQGMFV